MVQSKLNLLRKTFRTKGLTAGLIFCGLTFSSLQPVRVQASPSMLEFRWDNPKNYRKLYYWQSSSEKRDRSTYYMVLRPNDRKTAILKLSITVPDYFDSNITPKKLSLCSVHLGGMLTKTKCKEKLPAVFEVNKDQTRIDVFPNQPIPVDDSYAVVMKIFNPNQTGMFQFNALAQAPGDIPMTGYIGSWLIDIE